MKLNLSVADIIQIIHYLEYLSRVLSDFNDCDNVEELGKLINKLKAISL